MTSACPRRRSWRLRRPSSAPRKSPPAFSEDESAVTEETAKKARREGQEGEGGGEKEGAKSDEGAGGTGYTTEMKKAIGVVYNTLGMIALAKKNYTEAIKNYTHAVENDPALYEARLNFGRVVAQIPEL